MLVGRRQIASAMPNDPSRNLRLILNHQSLPMKLSILLALLILPAAATTVNTGALQTSFAINVFPPRISSVSIANTATVDLSSLSGITPGSDIAITFASTDDLLWLGGFGADDGDLTLFCHARLTLTAGAYSTFSDETWSFGPVPWTADLNPLDLVTFSNPVGYITGPVPQSFTLTVPWGTDLSSVSLTLTDLFSISGVNPFITQSGVGLEHATLTTVSVPEPSAAVLTFVSTIALLRRSRPKERRNASAPRA